MTGGVRVSVVVPVYNPGRFIEPLVDSLLAQTLQPPALEVIFVDDGSTDETPALLDRLAEEHAHFSVVHQPNSGWPGKPRNVGMDRARGDYVFFSDNDDWFGTEALERLLRVADDNAADIVVGRMVGHNRGVPRELFRRERLDATLENTQLEHSLTPHKLFRRQLLVDAGIRFPEGKRRLEDHVFVMKAYFAASRICVVTGYDFYHHIGREDASNAGYTLIDPKGYYGNVRETIDIVLANTRPGRVRDRILRRFLATEILNRLSEPRLRAAPDSFRRDLFDTARSLVLETMPESVEAGSRARQRLQTKLLRDGDRAGFDAVSGIVATGAGSVLEAAWDGASVTIGWRMATRPALVRTAAGGRHVLASAQAEIDVDEDLRVSRVDVLVVDAAKGEVLVPTVHHVQPASDGRLIATGTATLRFDGDVALPQGTWRLRLRMRALGWVIDSPLLADGTWRRLPAAVVGDSAVLARPAAGAGGVALLDVAGNAPWLDNALVGFVDARETGSGRPEVVLPLAVRGATAVPLRIAGVVVEAPLHASGAKRAVATLPPSVAGSGPVALASRARGGRWIELPLTYDADGGGRLTRDRRRAINARLRWTRRRMTNGATPVLARVRELARR